MIIRIILIVFAIYAISRVIIGFRKEQLLLGELFLWFAIWLGVIFVTIFPDITNRIAHIVGVGRGADLIAYLSLSVLFYVVFRIVGRLYKMEREITKLVTYIAVNEADKKEEKK